MVPVDLTTYLEGRAFHTWDRLLEGRVTRLPPNEDGLTVEHLSYLQSRLPVTEFVVKQFTGKGEGGRENPNVDFEWWIEHRGEVLGLRFQAKKLDVDLDKYADLDKPKALIQGLRAIEHRFRTRRKDRQGTDPRAVYRYPLYCLYTATDDLATPFPSPEWRRSYGCSVCSAPTVLAHAWEGRSRLAELASDMVPWAWLFAEPDLDSLEEWLRALLFSGHSGGAPHHAVTDPANDPGRDSDPDFVKNLIDDLTGSDRLRAATDPSRVVPPADARVPLEDAPAYVKRLGLEADLPVRLDPEDENEPYPQDVDFVALLRPWSGSARYRPYLDR